MLHLPGILDAATVARCRAVLDAADWADGKITAGTQSAQTKNNRQLPEGAPAAVEVREHVIRGLSASPLFFSAALPKRIFPPMFNRYGGEANAFGDHIDNAVRTSTLTGHHVRTDLSCTLFLSDPADYDGGELVVHDTLGERRVKLPAGDLILYPATTVHRVEPVTRGERVASFFWVESMVRQLDRRRLLHEMDMAIMRLRAAHGDTEPVVAMTGTYHNLLRMWVDV